MSTTFSCPADGRNWVKEDDDEVVGYETKKRGRGGAARGSTHQAMSAVNLAGWTTVWSW